MTPDSIRILSQLRHEFYTLFAVAMKVPVNVSISNSYSSNPPVASWLDVQQRLNYIHIFAYTAPDELVPKRPLILRVAINKGAYVGMARRGKGCQGLNQSWYFELTLLPEEMLDFLPWLVSLVKSNDRSSGSFVPKSPHPLDGNASNAQSFRKAWTQEASGRLSEQVLASQKQQALSLNTAQRMVFR